MTILIHVLGSDIQHHNCTILRFFNDHLSSLGQDTRTFMVVGQDTNLSNAYPELSLTFFSNKVRLAKAVIAKAKINRKQRFFFHGQFNVGLWLALLSGEIKSEQFNWHIWGADMYEVSQDWRFNLFYPLRRLAQGKVGCVFATRGDLNFFTRLHPKVRGELLYFPTRMNLSLKTVINNVHNNSKLTILVGNSGDPSNRHITALSTLYHQFGDTVDLILPMSYPKNNDNYINKVQQFGLALFSPQNIYLLKEELPFDDYISLLYKCDLGYFIFARQQGVGTICLLIQAGIPCVININNPFWQDMMAQDIPILFTTDVLNKEIVHNAQYNLGLVDKNNIDFFYPNYLVLWHQALNIASGHKI